ncbi:baseplate assembly protein [Aminobacterium colombiense]|uniref:Baseplate J family protein n=1 Tax=Aminobacterium colombiense (strain DSM 12261 / ALA-1) TaxID=572547 RepID=D5EF96_AMICL|nr:baseplate J/gp47 family protein [Aminobacterium colombiense]ADE57228.1 Baseplate J family protein [Aminobacterium colombiense DSM 12261]
MTLPNIDFTEKSTAEVEAEVFAKYEQTAGRILAKGDPVRLFLEAVAAVIAQQRVIIDFSAKQNLLAYSTGDYLDHLGDRQGVVRLPEQPSMATVRFSLPIAQTFAVSIPQGTRVTSGGSVFFATQEALEITPGATYVDAVVTCTQSGSIGNGFAIGQISKLVDPLPYISKVENITASTGGVDEESDDNFRLRIRQAMERYSVAGPRLAYDFWARTAHQGIIDVSVRSPAAGEVEIRPLMEGGELPSSEILDEVLSICSADDVRPLTDQVTVLAPEQITYSVDCTYFIDRVEAISISAIQAQVATAVGEYIAWQKAKLGRDINPSALIKRVMDAGAKRVEVSNPIYTALEAWQVAKENSVTINYGGLEDG